MLRFNNDNFNRGLGQSTYFIIADGIPPLTIPIIDASTITLSGVITPTNPIITIVNN